MPNCSFFLPVAATSHTACLKMGVFLFVFGHACGIFVPHPGIIPRTGVVSAESNHWVTREFPQIVTFLSLNKQTLGRWSSNSQNMISVVADMKRAA